MGALCCVASGPHGEKSESANGDFSMDINYWRANSSFSPPPSGAWGCRIHSLFDGSHSNISHESSSSHISQNKSRASSEQYPTNYHYYSVSDGALGYLDNSSENVQVPRHWSTVDRILPLDRGPRVAISPVSYPAERLFDGKFQSTLISSHPYSESGSWESRSRGRTSFHHRNIPSRRSFMSKPVHPLTFKNLDATVEDPQEAGKTASLSELIQSGGDIRLQKELSPGQSSGSREGFAFSNVSSYDMGFNTESVLDISDMASQSSSVINGDVKCELCQRLLRQRSPWSSCIVRTSDLPTAGVLSCNHVFHADCLEQVTPATHCQDPPCPLCAKDTNEVEWVLPHSNFLKGGTESLPVNQRLNCNQGAIGTNSDINQIEIDEHSSQEVDNESNGILMKKHSRKIHLFKGVQGKHIFSRFFC